MALHWPVTANHLWAQQTSIEWLIWSQLLIRRLTHQFPLEQVCDQWQHSPSHVQRDFFMATVRPHLLQSLQYDNLEGVMTLVAPLAHPELPPEIKDTLKKNISSTILNTLLALTHASLHQIPETSTHRSFYEFFATLLKPPYWTERPLTMTLGTQHLASLMEGHMSLVEPRWVSQYDSSGSIIFTESRPCLLNYFQSILKMNSVMFCYHMPVSALFAYVQSMDTHRNHPEWFDFLDEVSNGLRQHGMYGGARPLLTNLCKYTLSPQEQLILFEGQNILLNTNNEEENTSFMPPLLGQKLKALRQAQYLDDHLRMTHDTPVTDLPKKRL